MHIFREEERECKDEKRLQSKQVADSNKYFGVTTADDLSWTNRIETVAAEGNRTVGFPRRHFRDYTTKVKSATYITMVRPTLTGVCLGSLGPPQAERRPAA